MTSATDDAKREMLRRLADLERQEAALFADRALALCAVSELWRGHDDPATPFLALDVAVACQVAQITATVRMTQAHRLVQELPCTLRGLRDQVLTVGQALVLLNETDGLDPELVRQVDSEVFHHVVGLTAGDTRRKVKTALVQLDVLAAEDGRRRQEAVRRVWTSERPDGRAFLGAELSAEQVGTCWRALTELAGAVLDPTDDRTLDQQRADLLSQLPEFALSHLVAFGTYLTSRGVQGVRNGLSEGSAQARCPRQTRVQAVILIPVETALDLSDNPGELLGYGPVSGAHARELLALAEVRKACVDAHTGRMLTLEPPVQVTERSRSAGQHSEKAGDSDRWDAAALSGLLADLATTTSTLLHDPEHRYTPGSALADLVRLRDPRCSGPGCSAPSRACDLDHAVPWPTGPTSADNLGPLSRRCHRAKTHGDWLIRPRPDGSVTWTSPLGQTWTTAARHRPPDLECYAQRRNVWPILLTEVDEISHTRAA